MESIAHTKHLRQSAKKVRFVLDTIRNLNANEALRKLSLTNKKAAEPIRKTIASAIANITQKESSIDVDELFVKVAYVNEGPTMKRFRPAAMGRAVPIHKRTSHLTIVLSDNKS